jgi:hypothetical protein
MGLSWIIIVALIPWVIVIIVLWRGMKAQESIAESLRMIAKDQKQA